MNWKCYDCNMNFSNPSQLQKHKSRFCVGGMGDPDQLMLRKGFKSEVPKQRNDDPPVEDEPVSFDLHADPKVKQLAENHGRSMEAIQNRNRDLERQREEIRRRLEDLGRRPVKDEGMNDLLAELKEQEARNRQLLEDLRRQISNQHSVQPPAPVRHNNFAFPVYYGNSLTAEIAATRQGYLGNGGSDPDVLQQLAQMQAEAQAIDDNLKNQRPAPRQRDNKQSEHLLTLELENERLQRQLLLIQEQNLQSTHRRKGEREDELERDLRRMQQDHLRKMNDLQREMEKLRHESYWRASEKPSKIIVQSTHSPPPPPVAQYIEVDRLAPYDYSPAQPYAHTWAKTHYRQDVHHDPYYDLMLA